MWALCSTQVRYHSLRLLCSRWHHANYLMCCDTWSWPGWLRPIFRVPSAMLRWRSRRRPALTFTHDVSVTTETRGPDTEPVGYEPVTRQHTEDIQTAVCRARLGAAPKIICKALPRQPYIMWTYFLGGWFILSTSGEFSLLKDKYLVRTKCFVLSQPDNICWSAKIYCVK